MGENIDVFFKNENDAESAQAELRTLKVRNMYVEEMPEDADTTLLVPFFPTNIESSAGAAGNVGPITPIISDAGKDVDGPKYLSHLLHVEVETEDYNEVLSILEKHDCYSHKED